MQVTVPSKTYEIITLIKHGLRIVITIQNKEKYIIPNKLDH